MDGNGGRRKNHFAFATERPGEIGEQHRGSVDMDHDGFDQESSTTAPCVRRMESTLIALDPLLCRFSRSGGQRPVALSLRSPGSWRMLSAQGGGGGGGLVIFLPHDTAFRQLGATT